MRIGVGVITLSQRQKQVLSLLADGLTDDQIGMRLGISARTARAHVEALKQKLGVEAATGDPWSLSQAHGGKSLRRRGAAKHLTRAAFRAATVLHEQACAHTLDQSHRLYELTSSR
jgi:DNA-binding CsgD family transcriptional regulator